MKNSIFKVLAKVVFVLVLACFIGGIVSVFCNSLPGAIFFGLCVLKFGG